MGTNARTLVRTLCTGLAVFALGIGLGTLTLACGGEREERGLAPADEVSTPESQREMQMTEKQRRQQEVQQDQTKEDQEFNQAEQQGDEQEQEDPE
jgi:hypothetical protein